MKIETRENTTLINQIDNDLELVINHINDNYNSFREYNIIVDLKGKDVVTVTDINLFIDISDNHKKTCKKSFIVVADVDYNEVSDAITVVPTILEAHDIIEMEDIERDLGF